MLGPLNTKIQAQNIRSQQVSEMLMEFRLADLQHHLGSTGGSNTGNVVSDAERQIFGEKRGRHLLDKGAPCQHGGNKGRAELHTREFCL